MARSTSVWAPGHRCHWRFGPAGHRPTTMVWGPSPGPSEPWLGPKVGSKSWTLWTLRTVAGSGPNPGSSEPTLRLLFSFWAWARIGLFGLAGRVKILDPVTRPGHGLVDRLGVRPSWPWTLRTSVAVNLCYWSLFWVLSLFHGCLRPRASGLLLQQLVIANLWLVYSFE